MIYVIPIYSFLYKAKISVDQRFIKMAKFIYRISIVGTKNTMYCGYKLVYS